MKIIQSYVPWRNPTKIDLDKNYIYTMMLSSLLLKKNYGSVTLYTNPTQEKFLKNFNLPYEYNTEVLLNDTADVFAITKLKAMMAQTENFIHFDLDSFLFSKPNLDKRKSPFIFSHNDIAFLIKDINETENFEEKIGGISFNAVYTTYLKFYLNNLKVLESIEGYPHKYIKFDEIPNMNFIYVKDIDTFKTAITESLNVYNTIKSDIDKEWIGSAFIEQFTLPMYLKKLSKEYRDNIELSTLFENSPVQINSTSLIGNDYCSKCNNLHEIHEEIDLKNLEFDLSTLSYFHSGGTKSNAIVQFLVINTLINLFGWECVEEIHRKFYEFSLINRSGYKLSVGETLYEKYKGESIFTNLSKKTVF